MKTNTRKMRKAQSATEYLMTYGWAILAIAIVGALLYTQVFQTKKCGEGAIGFPMTGTLSPEGNLYGIDAAGNLSLTVKNRVGKPATITKVACDGTLMDITDVDVADDTVGEIISGPGCAPTGTPGSCFDGVTVTIYYTVDTGSIEVQSVGKLNGRYSA